MSDKPTSRNAGPKRRVRERMRLTGETYQQAQQAIRDGVPISDATVGTSWEYPDSADFAVSPDGELIRAEGPMEPFEHYGSSYEGDIHTVFFDGGRYQGLCERCGESRPDILTNAEAWSWLDFHHWRCWGRRRRDIGAGYWEGPRQWAMVTRHAADRWLLMRAMGGPDELDDAGVTDVLEAALTLPLQPQDARHRISDLLRCPELTHPTRITRIARVPGDPRAAEIFYACHGGGQEHSITAAVHLDWWEMVSQPVELINASDFFRPLGLIFAAWEKNTDDVVRLDTRDHHHLVGINFHIDSDQP